MKRRIRQGLAILGVFAVNLIVELLTIVVVAFYSHMDPILVAVPALPALPGLLRCPPGKREARGG